MSHLAHSYRSRPKRVFTHAPHLTGRTGAAQKVRRKARQQPVPPQAATRPPQEAHTTRLWGELHRRALEVGAGTDDTAWLETFAGRLPCGDCRTHWRAMLADHPPHWPTYFAWTVARHNQVNRRLGKPEIPVAEAMQRWSTAPAGTLHAG